MVVTDLSGNRLQDWYTSSTGNYIDIEIVNNKIYLPTSSWSSDGSSHVLVYQIVEYAPTITTAHSFTEVFANHPGGRPAGWYLHLRADLNDSLGVPGNIQSVVAENLDPVIDNNIHTLNYVSGGTYKLHPSSTGQSGTYRFTATNNQNLSTVLDAAPIDNPLQLDVIQNLAVSDNGTTPTVTFDPVANADFYRVTIFHSSNLDSRIYRTAESATPFFGIPAGKMIQGETYYLRAEAYDRNTTDTDGANDIENRSLNYLQVTPVFSITQVHSFTEVFANHPDGRPDGWYLHLGAYVDDPLGVPGNIQSVTVANLDSDLDPTVYALTYSTSGNDGYYLHPSYINQSGTYRFTVTNNQSQVAELNAHPIDNPLQLGIIQNFAVSDSSTAPTFTFDHLANAELYRITIYNDSRTEIIYQSPKLTAPFFAVPYGIMIRGNSYIIRAEAHDINTIDNDGVDDLENRSVNYMTFVPSFNAWFPETFMNTARNQFTCGVIDEKIYAFGGNNISSANLKSTEAFDPISRTWSFLADNEHNGSNGVEEVSGAVLNGKLYVFGAWGGGTPYGVFNFVEEYDPVTNTWTSKAPKPTITAAATAVAYNGEIYLFGGYFEEDGNPASRVEYDVVEAYNPFTDSWRFVTNIPGNLRQP
jgi:hypothetical protein